MDIQTPLKIIPDSSGAWPGIHFFIGTKSGWA